MLRESHRPGIEPATCKSQVQRPTVEPPRNTELELSDGVTDRAFAAGFAGVLRQMPGLRVWHYEMFERPRHRFNVSPNTNSI